MCDYAPGELLISRHKDDPVGERVVGDIEARRVPQTTLLGNLESRLLHGHHQRDLPWDLYRVGVPDGQELWSANHLQVLYQRKLAELLGHHQLRLPLPGQRNANDGFLVIPHGQMSLAGMSFSRWDPTYRTIIRAGSTGYTGANVRVAVIDSGLEPGLSATVTPTRNFVDDTQGASTDDDIGHGSGVTSIINAVAPAATIGVFKVADRKKDVIAEWDVLAALAEAASFDVINLSLVTGQRTYKCGNCGRQSFGSRCIVFANMIEHILSTNLRTVIVAAAGNDGVADLRFPAKIRSVVAVASMDSQQRLSTFSNYGTSATDGRPHPNVFFAPGGQGQQPGVTAENVGTTAGGYVCSGTSFAAPFVSGLFAVALSSRPDATRADAIRALTAASTKVAGLGQVARETAIV